jgi:hypothetical protein
MVRKNDSNLFKKLMSDRDLLVQNEGTIKTAECRLNGWSNEHGFLSNTAYNYSRLKGTAKTRAQKFEIQPIRRNMPLPLSWKLTHHCTQRTDCISYRCTRTAIFGNDKQKTSNTCSLHVHLTVKFGKRLMSG